MQKIKYFFKHVMMELNCYNMDSGLSLFNPLDPHDASKQHFPSLKINSISQILMFYNEYFHENILSIIDNIFQMWSKSSYFNPLQGENCDSNLRLVVD